MSTNPYAILGHLVWHVGKWYLRRRLPSARRVALTGAGLLAAAALTAVAARRLAG